MSYDPKKAKERLVLKNGTKCHWCCEETQNEDRYASDYRTVDHVVPRSKGGANAQDNLVISCFICNQRRKAAYYRNNPKFLYRDRLKVVTPKNEPWFFLLERRYGRLKPPLSNHAVLAVRNDTVAWMKSLPWWRRLLNKF